MRTRLIALVGALALFGPGVVSAERAKPNTSNDRELVGKVISVQPERNQIVIKYVEKGKSINKLFTVTDETTLFTLDGGSDEHKPLRLAELIQGSQVLVRYTPSRNKNVIRVLQLES